MKKLAVVLLLLQLFCLGLSNTIKITEKFTIAEISKNAKYLIDNEGKLSVYHVSSSEYQEKFSENQSDRLYFGFFKSNLWIKFTIQSFSAQKKDILLEMPYPLVKKIDLFEVSEDGNIKKQSAGLAIPHSEWPMPTYNPLFKIKLQSGESTTCYLKIENDGIDLSLPLKIHSEEWYYTQKSLYNFFHGMFYGMIMFIIIINIFFYFSLKSKMYIFFTLYVLSIGLFLLVRDGIAFKHLWPNCYWCAQHSTFAFVILSGIFLIIFTQHALKTNILWPQYHKLLYYIVGALILVSLISFSLDSPLYITSNIIVIIGFAPLLILGVKSTKDSSLALPPFYLIGLISMMAGSFIFILKNFGFVDYLIGEVSFKTGFICQLLVISFGLAAVYRKLLNSMHLESIESLKKLNQLKDQINIDLEKKVEERTNELNKLNQELIMANKQLGAERDIFETQRNLIAKQRQETTDSIRYAQRIQKTLIKSETFLRNKIDNYFILDIPKDIVSGDFYWVTKTDTRTFVAVADCTGHGVPGAFMSIIGITYLNDVINEDSNLSPAEILFNLRKRIVSVFKQAPEDEDAPKDGLDISLISIDFDNKTLEFAGAYNPLYIIRGRELLSYKGDRMPISIHEKENETFTNHTIQLKPNDSLYMFTDGYIDQFGWRSGKKFKHNQFKELLLEINEIPIEAQKVVLLNTIKNWMGDLEQVDDILVMGMKV